ncbi:MAG: hypothetical protein OXM55_04860 [Bdellovibrionales bacterium]|nr:hypothetical protein [Bdellovibrionales bacterium]
MGIEIVLYSSSPVIQKIFFHLLYHYGPTVHRVDQPSTLMEKVQYNQPDIIFIDDTFSSDLQNHIKAKKEALKNIPIILMAKQELDKQVLESSAAQGVLKKPITAGPLQELIVRFVPRAKSNILTKHLKFAPIPTFEEEAESSGKADAVISQDKKTPPSSTGQKGASPPGGIDLITEDTLEKKKVSKTSPPSDSSHSPSTFPPTSKEKGPSSGIDPVTATQRKEIQNEEEKGETVVVGPGSLFVDKKSNKMASDVSTDKEEKKTKDPPVAKKDKIAPLLDSTEVKIVKSKGPESQPPQPPQPSEPPLPSQLDTSDEVETEQYNKKEREQKFDFNTQLKDQINDYIQKWAKEKIQAEVEEQLKNFVEKKSQDIIQKTAEKAVWQVVPSLTKQLITKELEKLLKEEDGEDK